MNFPVFMKLTSTYNVTREILVGGEETFELIMLIVKQWVLVVFQYRNIKILTLESFNKTILVKEV